MFNFWTRRARKPSTGQSQKSANVLPLSQLDASGEAKASSSSPVNLAEDPSDQRKLEASSHIESTSSKEPRDEQATPQPAPEPYVTVTPNPHDSTISEIKTGLRQIEVLTGGPRRSEQIQTGEHHPSPDHTLIESLFDPATGEQRGTFESPHPISPTESNPPFDHTASKAANDEVWSHLARIRELQSDIAKLHAHMEGIGDTRHVLDLDVDTDIDVDSVPTQEEEEAVKRETAFKQLPKRFNGRSKNIDSVMSKVCVMLSQKEFYLTFVFVFSLHSAGRALQSHDSISCSSAAITKLPKQLSIRRNR